MKAFMENLAAYIRANPNPQLAARAYSGAAQHIRREAAKPENRGKVLQLRALANKLETLSAEAIMPEVDPHYGEEIHLFGELGPNVQTEYDQLIEHIAESKAASGGEGSNGDLLQGAVLENLQKEHAANIDSPGLTPSSATPGTLFGDSALVQYGGNQTTGALQESQVVRWDGRPNETMACTVALSYVANGANATFPAATNPSAFGLSYRPYARVLWGSSRGQPSEAIVDVGRGVQFTVTAANLYVNVGMDPPRVGATVAPGSMVLSATMGFYSGGRSTPVQRTQYVDSLFTGGGNKQNFIIPLFAISLLPIQVSEINTGACQIDWKDVAGNVICSSQLLVPGSQVAPIPIPNDAYSVDITNNGVATASFRLMWALSL